MFLHENIITILSIIWANIQHYQVKIRMIKVCLLMSSNLFSHCCPMFPGYTVLFYVAYILNCKEQKTALQRK